MDEFRRYWAKDDDESESQPDRSPSAEAARASRRTSRTSIGRSSRSSICRRRSRARCSRATRGRRSRCAGCFSTSSSTTTSARRRPRRVGGAAAERAERLYQRVFNDYGDDSVAQLGGVHLAVEDASNILTKVLERGRLMAYLEQSTRYIPYTERRGDAWRYLVPAELDGHPLREQFIDDDERRVRDLRAVDRSDARVVRARAIRRRRRFRRRVSRRRFAPRRSTRCAGCCRPRRSRTSGIYGTGQAYEALLLRMRAHPLARSRGAPPTRCWRSCAR